MLVECQRFRFLLLGADNWKYFNSAVEVLCLYERYTWEVSIFIRNGTATFFNTGTRCSLQLVPVYVKDIITPYSNWETLLSFLELNGIKILRASWQLITSWWWQRGRPICYTNSFTFTLFFSISSKYMIRASQFFRGSQQMIKIKSGFLLWCFLSRSFLLLMLAVEMRRE